MRAYDCYRFEERIYNDGIFCKPIQERSQYPSIDATYIIHLEGNGRLSKINEELSILHPTNRVWILHNKGYRGCHKDSRISSPAEDLVDCYYQVFRHATEHTYGNILILEDDFFFDESCMKDPEIISPISEFISSQKNTDFIYVLGCLPILQIPFGEHRRSICLGTHACIYSRKCRERVLSKDQKDIGDWDIWHNIHTRKYIFYKPLCYQLFPQTENQRNWLSNYLPEIIQSLFYLYIVLPFFQGLALDRSVNPGYPFFYTFSEWISILIPILFIYILYRFFMTIYHRK